MERKGERENAQLEAGWPQAWCSSSGLQLGGDFCSEMMLL